MYDTLIQIETVDGVCVVKIGNEVDIANANVLERYLLEAATNDQPLVVSLEDCRYIDSSGLRPIIKMAERGRDAFAVVATPGSQIRRIFDITNLNEVMHVCDDLAAATALVVRQSSSV